MKTVKPIGNRILVKPVPKKDKLESGIYLPEAQQRQVPQGTIVAMGADVKELKVGDFVQWTEEADTRHFEHNSQPHLIMYNHAIICKLED
tara:strand:- start:1599 stop:1868 length:270 start_codon:yes stop_codon:yes gene_type:complete